MFGVRLTLWQSCVGAAVSRCMLPMHPKQSACTGCHLCLQPSSSDDRFEIPVDDDSWGQLYDPIRGKHECLSTYKLL